MYLLDIEHRADKELVPNGRAKTFWGTEMLVSRIDFDPGVVVPEHKHMHEQFGVILSGELTLTVAGEKLVLKPGDMYIIPGNTPHSALAGPEGVIAAEVFSPVREDLKY